MAVQKDINLSFEGVFESTNIYEEYESDPKIQWWVTDCVHKKAYKENDYIRLGTKYVKDEIYEFLDDSVFQKYSHPINVSMTKKVQKDGFVYFRRAFGVWFSLMLIRKNDDYLEIKSTDSNYIREGLPVNVSSGSGFLSLYNLQKQVMKNPKVVMSVEIIIHVPSEQDYVEITKGILNLRLSPESVETIRKIRFKQDKRFSLDPQSQEECFWINSSHNSRMISPLNKSFSNLPNQIDSLKPSVEPLGLIILPSWEGPLNVSTGMPGWVYTCFPFFTPIVSSKTLLSLVRAVLFVYGLSDEWFIKSVKEQFENQANRNQATAAFELCFDIYAETLQSLPNSLNYVSDAVFVKTTSGIQKYGTEAWDDSLRAKIGGETGKGVLSADDCEGLSTNAIRLASTIEMGEIKTKDSSKLGPFEKHKQIGYWEHPLLDALQRIGFITSVANVLSSVKDAQLDPKKLATTEIPRLPESEREYLGHMTNLCIPNAVLASMIKKMNPSFERSTLLLGIQEQPWMGKLRIRFCEGTAPITADYGYLNKPNYLKKVVASFASVIRDSHYLGYTNYKTFQTLSKEPEGDQNFSQFYLYAISFTMMKWMMYGINLSSFLFVYQDRKVPTYGVLFGDLIYNTQNIGISCFPGPTEEESETIEQTLRHFPPLTTISLTKEVEIRNMTQKQIDIVTNELKVILRNRKRTTKSGTNTKGFVDSNGYYVETHIRSGEILHPQVQKAIVADVERNRDIYDVKIHLSIVSDEIANVWFKFYVNIPE